MNDHADQQTNLTARLPAGPLRRVHDYWAAGVTDGLLPGRQDLRPEDLTDILGHLFLIDAPEAGRYRYRLIGTRVAEWSGGDATGRYLDDPVCGESRFRFIDLVHGVVETHRPVATLGEPAIFGGSAFLFDRLMLPLAADGRNVDMILGVADMKPGPTGGGRRSLSA
ncbi:MAG: hypothetical protein TEF_09255 [Rhizobiales bacterium NRL2]|jgi:hypothetical protein|nr:MAG: hypothetical protein TEF_09255 [Rhizobiales bacterium NRL2]